MQHDWEMHLAYLTGQVSAPPLLTWQQMLIGSA
jgi:hypothetical protein